MRKTIAALCAIFGSVILLSSCYVEPIYGGYHRHGYYHGGGYHGHGHYGGGRGYGGGGHYGPRYRN